MLILLPRPDVANFAVMGVLVQLPSLVTVMCNLGFKRPHKAPNELVRANKVR